VKLTCSLLQLGIALGGAGLNWHLFGWQPVAITTTSGVIAMFFGALAKRLP
jgi:hypothetical protein